MNDGDTNPVMEVLSSEISTYNAERPWTVKLLERTQRFLLQDKARHSILKKMVDGNWHDLTSLWRVAKKTRPIGIVGVGMVLNALQEDIGMQVFENGGPPSQDVNQFDASWKVKDEFIGIMRAAISSLATGNAGGQSKQLNKSLERVLYKKVERTGETPDE